MKGQLENRAAIVTGGGTGIGEAVCRKFARDDVLVFLNGLEGDPIDDAVTSKPTIPLRHTHDGTRTTKIVRTM